jgi:hypothetical protein
MGHISSQFTYLGTIVTNQDLVQDEIKSRLNSGNACYHLVQNLLSSRVLLKNIKIGIYKTIILPVVLCGCEMGCGMGGVCSTNKGEEERVQVIGGKSRGKEATGKTKTETEG